MPLSFVGDNKSERKLKDDREAVEKLQVVTFVHLKNEIQGVKRDAKGEKSDSDPFAKGGDQHADTYDRCVEHRHNDEGSHHILVLSP
jgi:hypothetical protein